MVLGRKLETLRDIWQGWLYFGSGETTRQFLLIVDLILVAAISFLILRFFNTARGWKYLSLTFVAFIVLVLSAAFNLAAVHVVSQGVLIVLLIGLPIFFEEKWSGLFRSDPAAVPAAVEPAKLSGGLLGILAVLVAAVVVGLGTAPVKTAELPQGVLVSAAGLQEGISANFGTQKRINVIVQAPRSVWGTLKSDDFSAAVDVKNRDEGTHEVPVTVTSKNPQVKIIRAKPERLTVTLEPVIRKTVLIVAKFSGKAGEELVPDEPVFDPEKVEVTGPKSIIEDIAQAVAEVKLDGLTGKIDQKVALTALSSAGSVVEDVSFSPPEVQVQVALIKAGKLKTVGIRPKITGVPQTGFWVETVTVTPATVTVTGTADLLDKLSLVETDSISVSNLNTDTEITVALSLPAGIAVADSTTKVTAKLKLSPNAMTKQVAPSISYEGVDPSLKVTGLNPTSLNAIIAGSSALLANLGTSDVVLKLNLSPYKSTGTFSVTIKNEHFELKSGLTLVSFLPSAISVTLESK